LRCDLFYKNASSALPMLRRELRWLLLQVFGFILGNVFMLEYFGSIDALFKEGRPLIMGLFLLVAAAGHARRSLVDHGELRLSL
jgi:hypothetical protein